MEGVAGILLAGGRSQRMGRDKASLPWHGSTLARRAAGLLARCAEPPLAAGEFQEAIQALRGRRLGRR